jgi:hypothetical protein
MIDKKKFWANLKQTLKNMGTSTEKVLKDFEDADKKIEEKMKKATGNID